MIYLLLLLMIIYGVWRYDYSNKTDKRTSYYNILLIAFILVTGLRYHIGIDTIRYELHFEYIPTLFNITAANIKDASSEPLYFLIESFAKTIFDDFTTLQLIQSIFVNIIIFSFISKNTSNIFTGLLFYFILFYLNFTCEVMREACAVCILLIGWEYYKEEKQTKFLLCIIVSIFFHISAALLFVIPFADKFKLYKVLSHTRNAVFFLITTLIICSVLGYLFFDTIRMLSFFAEDRISSKIETYEGGALDGSLNVKGLISLLLGPIMFPYLAFNELKKEGCMTKQLQVMMFMYFLVTTISSPIMLFYRYNNYFFPFAMICMCECAYNKYKRNIINPKSLIYWILVISPYFALKTYGMYFNNIPETKLKRYCIYYPYSSIFDKQEDADRNNIYYYYGL